MEFRRLREESKQGNNTSVLPITTSTKTKDTDKKRKEIEELKSLLKQKEEEFKNLKMKYAAATSRATSLDKEIKGLKAADNSKLKVVIDKSDNDNKLIELLKAEVNKLKKNVQVGNSPIDV